MIVFLWCIDLTGSRIQGCGYSSNHIEIEPYKVGRKDMQRIGVSEGWDGR